MTLLLQTDSGLNVENAIIEDVFSSLGKSFLWATTTLERITMEDLKTKEYDKNSVPIRSIEFIEFCTMIISVYFCGLTPRGVSGLKY